MRTSLFVLTRFLLFCTAHRTFYCQSSVDLLVILYSEVICAWLIVSLVSNNLVTVEAKLLALAQMGGSGAPPASAPLLSGQSSSSAGAGMKTLQQQQHFKNYQSINMEEALP